MRSSSSTRARTARRPTFRHRLTPALLAVAFAGPFVGHSAAAADRPNETAVTRWNVIATNAFTPSQGTNPMAQSRTLAILHAAIHDALNAIEPRFQAYSPGLGRANGASAEAAVAAAARDVLVTLLPEQSALVESEYARALAAIPDGPAKSAAVALGQASARVNISRRQGDGADKAAQPYVPRTGPGEYQFTPPFDFAGQPGWGQVTPFVIDIREHTVAGPLDRSSSKYARDLAQVKAIGDINSAIRTREQSEIAQFWYEDSPLGWNRITNTAVRQRKLDLWSAARAFALVNFAMADGFIAGFEAKYRFRFWRPETAIRAAAQSEHGVAEADDELASLFDHATRTRLPVNAHGARLGGRRSPDRTVRRQDGVRRRQSDAARCDPTLQRVLSGGGGERPVAPLRRHPLLARDSGWSATRSQHRSSSRPGAWTSEADAVGMIEWPADSAPPAWQSAVSRSTISHALKGRMLL